MTQPFSWTAGLFWGFGHDHPVPTWCSVLGLEGHTWCTCTNHGVPLWTHGASWKETLEIHLFASFLQCTLSYRLDQWPPPTTGEQKTMLAKNWQRSARRQQLVTECQQLGKRCHLFLVMGMVAIGGCSLRHLLRSGKTLPSMAILDLLW